MSSIVVTIKTSKDYTRFNRPGQARDNFSRLLNLLTGLNAGATLGEVHVQGSTSDPVAASATATVTYADIAAAQTISLFGVTLTCKASGAGADEFNKQTNATVTAANLATAANANATISKYCVATSSGGVVTFTLHQKGAIGNFLKDITKSAAGIALEQWANGAGGVASSNVQVR